MRLPWRKSWKQLPGALNGVVRATYGVEAVVEESEVEEDGYEDASDVVKVVNEVAGGVAIAQLPLASRQLYM